MASAVTLLVLLAGTPAAAQQDPNLGELNREVPPPADTTNPARPPDVEIPLEGKGQAEEAPETPADLENLSILGKLRAYKRSFIPVPEIIVDPNEGNTFGLLGVWMFVNPTNENLEYMIAPDVRWNETKGVYPNIRFFGYPRDNFWYSLLVGKSTTRDENYELLFENWDVFGSRVFLLGEVVYERDSTRRFYGYGNDTTTLYESNYTDSNFESNLEIGTWLLKHLRASYAPRVRRFAVQAGQVKNVDPILPKFGQNFFSIAPGVRFPFGNQLNCPRGATKFSDCEGAGPQIHWGNRFAVSYDSRNDTDLPTEGLLGNVYFEFADRKLGSSTSYLKWGIEGRGYFPFTVWRLRPVLAMRAGLDYVNGGSDTPFWQRSALGGVHSLRGYGTGRFHDFNRSLMGAELRTTVYELNIFNTHAEIELAPFLEAGQVFAQLSDSPFDQLHPAGGMGVRGVVRPNVVGFVDLGYASEGLAIFTGINYPF
jgi:Omp85 superfamily domain